MEGSEMHLLIRTNVLELKVLFCLVYPTHWVFIIELWKVQLKVMVVRVIVVIGSESVRRI